MRKIIGILSIFLAFAFMSQAQKIKVACVGNSVTYGYGIKNRETNCYPAQLQQMLGDAYEVENFGHSGATLLNKGYRPYTQQEAYQKALRFAGDYGPSGMAELPGRFRSGLSFLDRILPESQSEMQGMGLPYDSDISPPFSF